MVLIGQAVLNCVTDASQSGGSVKGVVGGAREGEEEEEDEGESLVTFSTAVTPDVLSLC